MTSGNILLIRKRTKEHMYPHIKKVDSSTLLISSTNIVHRQKLIIVLSIYSIIVISIFYDKI